jgi:hypothetical protein
MDLELVKPFDRRGDLFAVDQEAVANLCEEKVQKLYAAKALSMLYAGLVSLANLPWMEKAERVIAIAALNAPQRKAPDVVRVSGFLQALSLVTDDDEKAVDLVGRAR